MNRRSLLGLIFGAPIAAVAPTADVGAAAYPTLPPGQAFYRGHTIVGVNEAQQRRWKMLHLLHSEGVVRG